MDPAPVRNFVVHHLAVVLLIVLFAVGEAAVYVARLAFGW